jgi:nicotinamidase-related amidase
MTVGGEIMPDRRLPDPAMAALLVIDMQNDFVLQGYALPAEGAEVIVPRVADLARVARQAGVPVIFTLEQHRSDMSDFGIELEFEPPHCLEGSDGAQLVDALRPAPGDFIVQGKRRYDAFLGTELDTLLRSLGRREVVLTGVCTDICVSATAQHARNLDYRVFLVRDCCAGSTETRHEAALQCLGHVFAYLIDLDQALQAFSGAGRQVVSA